MSIQRGVVLSRTGTTDRLNPDTSTKIKFIKTLAYKIRPENEDVFEYLSALTMQKIDPPSISNTYIQTNAKTVFHSPLKRVIDTLELKRGVKYIRTDELSEILFDIGQLCTRQEWQEKKSDIIRQRFKEFFIKDRLPVKRIQIFDEIRGVLNDCLSQPKSFNVAVISHSFRLKLIEIFIDTKGRITNDPALIHKYISDNQKTYEFGGGFSIKRNILQQIKEAPK